MLLDRNAELVGALVWEVGVGNLMEMGMFSSTVLSAVAV